MKSLYVLVCLFLFFSSCALTNVSEITSDRVAISQHDEFNEETQKLHYILLKIPTNDWMDYKNAILKTNKEIGFASLRLTTILMGKPNTDKEQYILFRRFQNFDEANEYAQLLVENSSLKGLEGMMVVTQEGYRKFNRDKNS